MSATKATPAKKPVRDRAVKNGAPEPAQYGDVLTLSEAATYLRVREEDVLDMVRSQGLMGRQVGKEWRFLKGALQYWLGGDTRKSSKQALLDLAGKFRDDPYLDAITREAYRRRSEASE